jgi:hypothetical protein
MNGIIGVHDIIKTGFKDKVWECGLNLSNIEQDPMKGCCGHVKGEDILDEVSNCQFLKKRQYLWEQS